MKKYNDFVTENKDRVIYSAVFLTEKSVSMLKAAFPPKYENVFYHHSTIKFKPSQEEIDKLPLGEKDDNTYTLKVIGIAKDDKAEAVLVENEYYDSDGKPHITLSTDVGVKPFYSNKLLANGDIEYFDEPLFLEAVIDTFPR